MQNAQASAEEDPRAAHYSFWIRSLQGEHVELVKGRAESGFYRQQQRDGTRMAIAIWRGTDENEDKLYVKRGTGPGKHIEDEEAFCENTFAWCARHPVSESDYQEWLANGRWPDDAPPPVQVSNLPADPFEALMVEVQAELEELRRAIAEPVTTKQAATRLGNWQIRFNDAWKKAEEMRVAEKRPHDEAATAVQRKFKPLLSLADEGRKLIDSKLTEYLHAERKRLAEERQRLADLARKEQIAEDVLPPEPPKAKVETVGRSVSLVTRYTARVDDWDKAIAFLKDHPDLKIAVQRIADAAARSKSRLPIDGVTYVESTSTR